MRKLKQPRRSRLLVYSASASNSELPDTGQRREIKGRVVFDGSDVRDQDKQVALFQELSSSPATMRHHLSGVENLLSSLQRPKIRVTP